VTETPEPWDDLIRALTLLSRGAANDYPFQCSHDTLFVNADREEFTPDELKQLEDWGFFLADEEGFMSYRFGSC
jgi:hypothetical protein